MNEDMGEGLSSTVYGETVARGVQTPRLTRVHAWMLGWGVGGREMNSRSGPGSLPAVRAWPFGNLTVPQSTCVP